jgi:hypothetical protein
MIRLTILILLLMVAHVSAFAQKEIYEDSSWDLKERGYMGIGLGGLGFGTYAGGNYFSIGASVLGGYMLTRNLSTGVGFEYQYTSYSYLKLRNHLYGGYPFLRYNIKNFFLQADYTMYSVQVDIRNAGERQMMDRMFVGVGFSSPSGGRGFMNFLVSYDFLYTNMSRWGSPLNTRLFFTF